LRRAVPTQPPPR